MRMSSVAAPREKRAKPRCDFTHKKPEFLLKAKLSLYTLYDISCFSSEAVFQYNHRIVAVQLKDGDGVGIGLGIWLTLNTC